MMDGIGDPANLRDLIQAAQKIQADVTRVKDDLARREISGESGGGLVRCVVSGTGDLVSLTIDPLVRDMDGAGGFKMLPDLVVGAVNVALERAREVARDEMARVTGGLAMPPGMFGG